MVVDRGGTALKICERAIELLAGCAFYSPEGQRQVVAAMEHRRTRRREAARYLGLVDALRLSARACAEADEADVLLTVDEHLAFHYSVAQFINTLIASSVSVEDRCAVRRDFLCCDV